MLMRHSGYYNLAKRVHTLMRQQMKTHLVSDLSHVFDDLGGTGSEDWAHVPPRGNGAVTDGIVARIAPLSDLRSHR